MLEKFLVCYHGTVDIKGLMIRNNGIDLSVPVPGTDFGQGFYLTSIREQVEEWARNKARDVNDKNNWINAKPVVLRYRINIEKLSNLSGNTFMTPSLDWGQFILTNRQQSQMYYELPYDYVVGPVADGYMRNLMNALKINLITKEEFIKGITPKGAMATYNQLSIHSIEAINCLTLEEVEYIEEI